MQMDPDLTLENAKKMVRQKEAVKEQQQELKCDAGGTQENNIDRVKLPSKERGKFTQEERSGSKCHRCGKKAHIRKTYSEDSFWLSLLSSRWSGILRDS